MFPTVYPSYSLYIVERLYEKKSLRNSSGVLYHFVQFGQGGDRGQAGRNLDVGHPEVDRGHLPEFGQSKRSAACASSSLRCRADPELSVILQRQWTSSDMQLKLYLDSNEKIFTKKRGQGANIIEIN